MSHLMAIKARSHYSSHRVTSHLNWTELHSERSPVGPEVEARPTEKVFLFSARCNDNIYSPAAGSNTTN